MSPFEEPIGIRDIARSLSRMPRFAGRTERHVSVAQHSILVSYLTEGNRFEALMHDAAESITNDIPSPVKTLLGVSIKNLDYQLWERIASAYNLPLVLSEATHRADQLSLLAEAQTFGRDDCQSWKRWDSVACESACQLLNASEIGRIWRDSWGHREAEEKFISRYLSVR